MVKAKEFVLKEEEFVWLNEELKPGKNEDFYTMLFFWSTSCHECPDIVPAIHQLMEHSDLPLSLITVHVPLQEDDLKIEMVHEKSKQYDLHYPTILDHRVELIQRLGVQFVPTMIIFDEKNKKVSSHIGSENIETYMEEIKRLVRLALH